MSLFVVDEEKCKRDGVCIATCPAGIIEFRDEKSVPTPIDGADELCISCGHCVAVCPHGALSHTNMTPEQCPSIQKEWLPNAEQIEHFLRARRSIRVYKDQAVEREVLTKLIDVARFAPSGHNSQTVSWLVINDSGEIQRLAGLVVDWMRSLLEEESPLATQLHMDRVVASWEAGIDRVCRSAPHLIVAHAPKDERTAQAACTIALTFLELAAFSFSLGTCWAGYVNAAANSWLPMQHALELPGGHTSFGAMMVGYSKYGYQRLPIRNEAQITWR